MRSLNRAALIVRFKEPYIRWAAGLDPDDTDIADDLRRHTSVYLVPEDPLDVQETAPLADFFGAVFDLELEAWCIDDSLWPPVRDLDTFLEWFEVVGESVVVDLGREPLRSEEM